MRLPLMVVLIDASSTAASHDPGATLRRLRPPYHTGDSTVESDRGIHRWGVGSGEWGVTANAARDAPHPQLPTPHPKLVEQRTHGLLRVRIPNRLAQQLADREDDEALEPTLRGQVDRVGDDHLDDRCGLEAFDGRSAEYRVRGADVDVVGAEPLERPSRLRHRPRRIDHVVGEDAIASLHVADDVYHLTHVRARPALVDDRQRGVEPLREPTRHLGRADVWR